MELIQSEKGYAVVYEKDFHKFIVAFGPYELSKAMDSFKEWQVEDWNSLNWLDRAKLFNVLVTASEITNQKKMNSKG